MIIPVPRKLADNPWFWVALFGGVGLVGVMLIGPKFTARWSRVERMQETRERVAIEKAQKSAAVAMGVKSEATSNAKPKPDATPTGSDDPSSLPEREPYVEADFQQPMPLRFLLVLMMVVMSVGTTGLIVTRGRERRAAELAAAEAASSHPTASNSSTARPPHA
jgi:hypothetical protein